MLLTLPYKAAKGRTQLLRESLDAIDGQCNSRNGPVKNFPAQEPKRLPGNLRAVIGEELAGVLLFETRQDLAQRLLA